MLKCIEFIFLFLITIDVRGLQFDQSINNEIIFKSAKKRLNETIFLMTAESTKFQNFFHFRSLSSISPSFIMAGLVSPQLKNFTIIFQSPFSYYEDIKLKSSEPFNESNLTCTVFEVFEKKTFLDCSTDLYSSICQCLFAYNHTVLNQYEFIQACSTENTGLCSCFQLFNQSLLGSHEVGNLSRSIFCNQNVIEDPHCTQSCLTKSTLTTRQNSHSLTFTSEFDVVNIPSLTTCNIAKVSTYFLEAIAGAPNQFSVNIYKEKLFDYPLSTASYTIFSEFSEVNELEDIKTIFKTQFVKHDKPYNLYCKYNVTYTGFIRFVNVNDIKGYSHTQPTEKVIDDITSEISETWVILKPNVLNVITVVGFKINYTEINFLQCNENDWDGNVIDSNFEYYYFDNSESSQQIDLTGSVKCTCPTGCIQCDGHEVCLRCTTGYYYYNRTCVKSCPASASFQLFSRCSKKPVNLNVFLTNPVISDYDTSISIDGYLDYSSPISLIGVFTATNQLVTNPLNFTLFDSSFKTGISESRSIIINQTEGYYNFTTELKIIASSMNLGSDYINFAIFLFDPTLISNIMCYMWSNTLISNANPILRAPSGSSVTKIGKFYYLNKLATYLSEFVLDCSGECTLLVTCDGYCFSYLNDRILLFEINFVNKWTYIVPTSFSGTNNIKIYSSKNFYFAINIQGKYKAYQTQTLLSSNLMKLPMDFPTACQIPNCLTCYGLRCLSCQSGYYLDSNEENCLSDCDAEKFSRIERKCFTSCDGERIELNSTDCTPKCFEKGLYYSYQEGKMSCVDECDECSSSNECKECKYFDEKNTQFYCFRKSGGLYNPITDFSNPQSGFLLGNFSKKYAAILTDYGSFADNTFFFYKNKSSKPRILLGKSITAINSSFGELKLPSIQTPESGNLSLHYLIIVPNSTDRDFSISAFEDISVTQWPLTSNNYVVTPINAPLTYNNPEILSKSDSAYPTVIMSKLYENDNEFDIFCSWSLSFTGYVKGMYLNGELIFFDSQKSSTMKTAHSNYYLLKKKELYVLTLFVGNFSFSQIEIGDCRDSNNKTLSIQNLTIKTYLFSNQDSNTNHYFLANNSFCSNDCNECLNSTYCFNCKSGYYLFKGICLDYCPEESKFYSMGFCTPNFQQKGHKASVQAQFASNLFYYNWLFTFDQNMTLIWYTAGGSLSLSNFKLLRNSRESSTLSESQSILLFLQKDKNLITGVQSLSYSLFNTSNRIENDLTTAIYTIKNNSIMINYAPASNTMNSSGFYYLDSSNKSLQFDLKYEYSLHFYLNCLGLCKMTIGGHGFIQIIKNDRTLLFEAFKDDYLPNITLERNFTNLTLFRIVLKNTSKFYYEFTGIYYIFTYQDFLNFEVLRNSITVINCSMSACKNCHLNYCYSCSGGSNFFLDQLINTCNSECPSNSFALQGQNICSKNKCSELNLIQINNTCSFECNPGFYWSPSIGCSNKCYSTCKTCSGPKYEDCLTCLWPYVKNSDSLCVCPPGSVFRNQTCQSISYLTLVLPRAISSCSDLVIFGSFNQTEADFGPIKFIWTLESIDGLQLSSEFVNFVSNNTSNNITIPKNYLENARSYKFSASYINNLNLTIGNSSITSTTLDLYPNAIIDKGSDQRLFDSEENTLRIVIQYSECLPSTSSFGAKWNLMNNTSVSLDSFFNPSLPLSLTIPKCAFLSGSEVNLTVKLWQTLYPNYFIDLPLRLEFVSETRIPIILNGNKRHYLKDLLKLRVGFQLVAKCGESSENYIYTWTCENYDSKVPCLDDSHLFNKPSTSNELLVNTSNFAIQTLNISVRMQTLRQVFYTSTIIFLSGVTTINIEIRNQENYVKFTPNSRDYLFNAVVLNENLDSEKISYRWELNTNHLYYSSGNILKIPVTTTTTYSPTKDLKISIFASDGVAVGNSFIYLPYNSPPIDGNITIVPRMGESLNTYFLVQANGWKDQDLPLSYQFSYYADFEAIPDILTEFQSIPFTSTILPKSSYHQSYLRLTVQDSFGSQSKASTSVEITSNTTSIQNFISKTNTMLSKLDLADPFERAKTISILTSELSIWENRTGELAQPCPICSNHGYCENNICICNIGWYTSSCSMTLADYNKIITYKTILLEKLKISFQDYPNDEMKSILYKTLQETSQNQNFNSNNSLSLINDILRNTLNVTDPDLVLTKSNSLSLSNILSSFLTFISENDCKANTDFTKFMANDTISYLDLIGKSLLNTKILNETVDHIDTNTYSILVKKIAACDLNSIVINLDSRVPLTQIKYDTNTTNCSEVLNFQMYAFDSNLMTCNNSDATKFYTLFYKVLDSKGNHIKINSSISIKIPEEDMKSYCQEPCSVQNGFCFCEDSNYLDVKYQILKIFFSSSLIRIPRFDSILSSNVIELQIFWALIVFLFWFGLSVVLIRKFCPTFDIIQQFEKELTKTRARLIWVSFTCVHPLLSVFYVGRNHELSKSLRAFMYFQRNILIMSFSAFFGSAGGNDDLLSRIINFTPYLFILPYFTIFPLQGFLEWCLSKPSDEIIQEKNISPQVMKFIRNKYHFGVFVSSIVVAGCFISDLVIAATASKEEKAQWTADLIKSLAQDLILTPIIYLFGQYSLLKFLDSKKSNKVPIVKRILSIYLNEPIHRLSKMPLLRQSRVFPVDKLKLSSMDLNFSKTTPNLSEQMMVSNSPDSLLKYARSFEDQGSTIRKFAFRKTVHTTCFSENQEINHDTNSIIINHESQSPLHKAKRRSEMPSLTMSPKINLSLIPDDEESPNTPKSRKDIAMTIMSPKINLSSIQCDDESPNSPKQRKDTALTIIPPKINLSLIPCDQDPLNTPKPRKNTALTLMSPKINLSLIPCDEEPQSPIICLDIQDMNETISRNPSDCLSPTSRYQSEAPTPILKFSDKATFTPKNSLKNRPSLLTEVLSNSLKPPRIDLSLTMKSITPTAKNSSDALMQFMDPRSPIHAEMEECKTPKGAASNKNVDFWERSRADSIDLQEETEDVSPSSKQVTGRLGFENSGGQSPSSKQKSGGFKIDNFESVSSDFEPVLFELSPIAVTSTQITRTKSRFATLANIRLKEFEKNQNSNVP